MASFLRKYWLLIVLFLTVVLLITTVNGYRRVGMDDIWMGLIIAGAAFLLFGFIGNILFHVSEKVGIILFTMKFLFILLNGFLLSVHVLEYYNDNFVQKPFEYYNHSYFVSDGFHTETFEAVQRSCVNELKELTRGKIARISSLGKNEVCDSVGHNCYYTCRLIYQLGEDRDSKSGFMRYYVLDSSFQITSKGEINFHDYRIGDSERWDSLLRQEIRSTLNNRETLEMADSILPEVNIKDYINKLDQLEEAAKENGMD